MASDDTFTARVPKKIVEHMNFNRWRAKIDNTQFIKIEAAIAKIENEGLITNSKDLKDGLYEKKWRTGLRMYFAIIEDNKKKKTLLLLGSGKNSEQNRVITKSKRALEGHIVIKEDIRHNPSKIGRDS